MAPPAQQPPAGGKGQGLKRKIGPLPLWAWALVVAGAGWYLWRKLGSGQAAVATTQAAGPSSPTDTGTVPTAGTGGDTSGAGVGGIDASALASALGAQQQGIEQALADQQATQESDLANALAQMESFFASGAGGTSATGDGANNGNNPDPFSAWNQVIGSQPGGSNAPTVTYNRTPASTPNFGSSAAAQTTALKAQGAAVPFGGVVSVRKLANGATLTTYASGRQVEQAPGKSAYVVKA